jgi:hypothetical protein
LVAHNGTMLWATLLYTTRPFGPNYSRHDSHRSPWLQMQRLLHTRACVHIHPLQRQWRTTVHAAGRSQRGVPKMPRAAACGLCGNSKSGAMGSSRQLRPTCRLNWWRGVRRVLGSPRSSKNGGVARGRRQFCGRACGLTRLARRAPRCVPTRSIAFSASGGSPGSYRPRRQSDRSSS